jgi:hypothetical protein
VVGGAVLHATPCRCLSSLHTLLNLDIWQSQTSPTIWAFILKEVESAFLWGINAL